MRARVIGIQREGERVQSVRVRDAGGDECDVEGDQFLSSMPIRTLIRCLDPLPPQEVVEAANSLRYRDFLTVALIIDREDLFPDNWIYIHSNEVRVGRIQNFKNWSADMVPDRQRTTLGLEYFVQENDEVWSMDDAALLELGRQEVAALNLASADDVIDGTVVRVPKAYPILRRQIPGRPPGDPRVARWHRESAAHWPKRPTPLQQPGSFDGHGRLRGPEHHGPELRHLGRERRGRIP